MAIVQLAWRNLSRNRRRTLFAVLAIGVGLALSITGSNFSNGARDMLLAAAVEGTAGHLVVQAPGWQKERDPAQVVNASGQVAETLRARWPGGEVVRRALIGGLLTSPRGSNPVVLSGVDPGHEAGVAGIRKHLARGTWLDDQPGGVVIGEALARMLQVDVGDKIVFMAQVGDGDMKSKLFRVRGVVDTGMDGIDAGMAVTWMADAQALLPGDDPVHQVAVLLDGLDVPDIQATRAALPGHEVLTWTEAIPELAEQMQIDRQFDYIVYGALLAVVAAGVLNTVLMGMMERVRELGVLVAIGMQPRLVARMLLTEGLLMGLLGTALGLVLCVAAYPTLYVQGIDFGDIMKDAAPTQGVVLDTVVHASIHWDVTLVFPTVGIGMAVLAAAWPAWKALRIEPIEAMRHV